VYLGQFLLFSLFVAKWSGNNNAVPAWAPRELKATAGRVAVWQCAWLLLQFRLLMLVLMAGVVLVCASDSGVLFAPRLNRSGCMHKRERKGLFPTHMKSRDAEARRQMMPVMISTVLLRSFASQVLLLGKH